MTESDFCTLQIAGLLHDIGEILQYKDQGTLHNPAELSTQFVQQYEELFRPWINCSLLTQIVSEHHNKDVDVSVLTNTFTSLLSHADKHSSPKHNSEQSQGLTKEAPLASIFSRLRLYPFNNPEVYYYNTQAYSPEIVFPIPETDLDIDITTGHINAFDAEIQKLKQLSSCLDYPTFYCHLLTVLEKYTWCFPASSEESASDVSLYEHLRTTSAIVSTMYLYHKTNDDFSISALTNDNIPKFLLVAGDLSGIQPYLFDITNIGVGGAARRLRARSFFLSALMTSIAHKITRHFQLPPVNIISKAGGNFYILLPNVPDAKSYLDRLRQEINANLLDNYGGDLAMHLTYVPFAGKDFENYNLVAANARDDLSRSKLSPFSDLLMTNGTWCEDNFLLSGPDGEPGYCRSCRKLPVSSEDPNLCRLCLLDTKAGRWLTKAQTIAYYATEPKKDREKIPLPGGLWVVLSPEKPLSPDPFVVFAQDPAALAHLPALSLDSYTYVPTDHEENIASFDSLADQARGKKLLGILKADVDNLGALFSLGLGEEGSISRVSTMSRLLESFFGGWLPCFLKKEYPDAYVVYSGGDDLLIVAPWNQAIKLATAVRENFSAFTAFNQDITLSAGIAIVKPRQPLARTMIQAEEALERSKEKPAKAAEIPKDQCTALGETIKWEHIQHLIKEAFVLEEWIQEGILPRTFLQRLLVYASLYDRYSSGDPSGLKYISLLHWDIKRNLARQKQRVLAQWATRLMKLESPSIRHLGFIARFALLLTQSTGKEG